MKRNRILNVVLIFFAVAVISCKENEALEYVNDPALYFVKNQYGQSDSITHSFALLQGSPDMDTVWVEVQTMGFLSDINRPMRFRQTNVYHEDTAKYVARPGVHYVPFDDPELQKLYYVPANRERAKIPVVLLRDESLDTMKVHLTFTIEENENFRPGLSTQLDFKVTTTAAYDRPANWSPYWQNYVFGTWGPAKMKFIMDTIYIEWDPFPTSDMGYVRYLFAVVQSALNKYNAEHPDAPLTEADGTKVVLDRLYVI